jgi:hypothetical protein
LTRASKNKRILGGTLEPVLENQKYVIGLEKDDFVPPVILFYGH